MEWSPEHPLHHIKRDVREMQQRMDGAAWAHVSPRSDLARDDEVEHVVHVSVSGAQPLLAAVDHMHAFVLILEAGNMTHIAAPSTLLRGVIESASQVVWLLAPEDRPTRVLRSLRLQHEDAHQQVAAHSAAVKVLEVDHPEYIEAVRNSEARKRLASLEEAGTRLGIDLKKMKLTSTQVLNEASAVTGLQWAPWVWRVSSGVAHGRPWALLSSNLTEVIDGYIGEGRHRVHMSVDEKVVIGGAIAAWRMLERANELWNARRRNHRAAARARAIAFDSSLPGTQIP